MDIKTARNITRKFVRNNIEYSPILSSDWRIFIRDNSVFVKSSFCEDHFYLSSAKDFLSTYLLSDTYHINKDNFIGNYYYTSLGLVNDEDFFLAEDVIEENSRAIKKNELQEGIIYVSDKGIDLVYLGALNINKIILEASYFKKVSFVSEKTYFLNIQTQKIVPSSSIRIIKSLNEEYPKNIDINDNILDKYRINSVYISIEIKYNNSKKEYFLKNYKEDVKTLLNSDEKELMLSNIIDGNKIANNLIEKANIPTTSLIDISEALSFLSSSEREDISILLDFSENEFAIYFEEIYESINFNVNYFNNSLNKFLYFSLFKLILHYPKEEILSILPKIDISLYTPLNNLSDEENYWYIHRSLYLDFNEERYK